MKFLVFSDLHLDRAFAWAQVLGRIGNSGNTSEPHLHIHLQDSPNDDADEGIPLYFHHYRLGDQLIERGMHTGRL
jgi:hypothetical protein